MTNSTRVAAYAAVLAAVFLGAAGVGRAVGPVGTPAPAHGGSHSDSGRDSGTGDGHDEPHPDDAAVALAQPPGLTSALDGYRLVVDTPRLRLGRADQLRLRIVGPDRRAVTAYTVEHEKELHLVVVRRDGSGYQHLHPSRDADGTWSVPITLPAAGQYKVIADFTPAARDDGLVLAGDVSVPGDFVPVALPRPDPLTTVDGYMVELPQVLDAGAETPVTFTVHKGGRPVADLEPYLGAYGHLVVLRSSDLAYLHVHPQGEPGTRGVAAGPQVRFLVETPTEDDYRIYFEFKHGGDVRTAEFTREAR